MVKGKPWQKRSRDYKNRCGNCHAYIGEAGFCVYCGTKAGEGAFAPYEEIMQCVYGPPPVEREHTCTVCGHVWSTCAMIDRVRYCPQCGGAVATRTLGDPFEGASDDRISGAEDEQQ